MKKVLHFIDESLEEAFAVIAMALMAVIMGIQVIARYVFNSSLSWPEEVSVYLLIWMGMLSLSYCIRKNASIKVEMIIDLFPEKVRKFFHLLEDIISILFYGLSDNSSLAILPGRRKERTGQPGTPHSYDADSGSALCGTYSRRDPICGTHRFPVPQTSTGSGREEGGVGHVRNGIDCIRCTCCNFDSDRLFHGDYFFSAVAR